MKTERTKITEAERKKRPCSACGKPVGTATIVCGGPYPEAPLCFDCGTRSSLEEVYAAIEARFRLPRSTP